MRGCPTVAPDRQGREEEGRKGSRDVEELDPPLRSRKQKFWVTGAMGAPR